jgi:FixJ family two-component response regulator
LEASVPDKPVISIVDDDETIREGTMDLFRSMGFDAEAYASAADFLSSCSLRNASCLIADVQMPGMTGFELHKRLVRSGNSIPTILMTGYPDDRDRARALQAGVICYLAKPLVNDELFAGVSLALQPHERHP